ncbi:MAG: succinylglutamate desuccinylase/aspartoacylase family protein [Rhizobiaceae bacterium]|nr:succinylglutamate desuccinylase/aspartoacylase family protein [Rhizobiaceae bacterium]
MEKTVEIIRGDTPGTEWRFPVLRFSGADASAPTAYLQAALHGSELPGVAALHYLVPELERAEGEGRLRGAVTIVPQANPIGAGQHLFLQHMGRFSFHSRSNFNRDFPLLADTDTSHLPRDDAPIAAEKRLKARLVTLALGHDLVLDLHCDDEGPSYLYIARAFWPHMADLAASLGSKAVLLWDGTSDAAFEEAAWAPLSALPDEDPAWARKAATTVEFRGESDVSPELGRADAAGLYRFLVARGTIEDGRLPSLPEWSGTVTPLANVEMVRAPVGGAVLYHVSPGDHVEVGQRLVTLLTAPGEIGGETHVTAPQAGMILTRKRNRLARIGDDLLKLLGSKPSETAKSGSLES